MTRRMHPAESEALAKRSQVGEHANRTKLSADHHLAPACAPPSMRMFSPFTMGADCKYSNASTISETCTKWNGPDFFQRLVVVVRVHRSVHNSRRDRFADTVGHELHRQFAVKSGNGGLGKHWQRNRRASQGLIRQNRRDADDMAGFLFPHLRPHLSHEKVTGDVRANHQLEVSRCIVGERLDR